MPEEKPQRPVEDQGVPMDSAFKPMLLLLVPFVLLLLYGYFT